MSKLFTRMLRNNIHIITLSQDIISEQFFNRVRNSYYKLLFIDLCYEIVLFSLIYMVLWFIKTIFTIDHPSERTKVNFMFITKIYQVSNTEEKLKFPGIH